MVVLLADGTYVVHRRPHPWPRDAHGTPVPTAATDDTAALPGAATRQLDGSWTLRLDPAVWPVYAGDTITRVDDGFGWTITEVTKRVSVPGAPDVDYVAVAATRQTPDPDRGYPR